MMAEDDADHDDQPDVELALAGQHGGEHERGLPGEGTPIDSRPMIAGSR